MPSPSAGATHLAGALIDSLPWGDATLFNPYRDRCEHDLRHNDCRAKRERLAHHLDCDARLILVGEAPGYQGCRYSGVAFTSERLLLEGSVPRIPRASSRLTSRRLPFSEPSATIVWKTLYHLGITETTVLWNALQLHPVGSAGVWSNRTPTKAELQHGKAALSILRDAFPAAKMVAVGRKAEATLLALGLDIPQIRHPAKGGALAFSTSLKELMMR
jgi:hypothetical protein